LQAPPTEPPGPAIGGGTFLSKLISDAIGTQPGAHPGSSVIAEDDAPTIEAPASEGRPRRDSAPPPYGSGTSTHSPQPTGAPLRPPLAAVPPPPNAGVNISFDSFGTDQLRSLEIDEVPDSFKIKRRAVPRWMWRAALAGSCVVLGVVIGLLALSEERPPRTASIEIVSIPGGARVIVDGAAQTGVTPMSVTAKPGASYRIVVHMERYEPWERVEKISLEGGAAKVIAALKPILVTLHVDSIPEGAEVFLNGRSVGRTPLTLTRLDPAVATTIEVRAMGYRPERRDLSWGDRTELRVPFTLRR
jgi:hypothetical protein